MQIKDLDLGDLDLMGGLDLLIQKAKANVGALEEAKAKIVGQAPRKRGPGRSRKSERKAATATPRKRRKRKGGTRADQALKLIEQQPGISASDVAKTMKIKPNYLYRVLGDLEKEGRVKKDGRQYYPVAEEVSAK